MVLKARIGHHDGPCPETSRVLSSIARPIGNLATNTLTEHFHTIMLYQHVSSSWYETMMLNTGRRTCRVSEGPGTTIREPLEFPKHNGLYDV